ncbi:MAG: hypothetical protein ABIC40_01350 [bacterium]
MNIALRRFRFGDQAIFSVVKSNTFFDGSKYRIDRWHVILNERARG